jgi:hypothetical protein
LSVTLDESGSNSRFRGGGSVFRNGLHFVLFIFLSWNFVFAFILTWFIALGVACDLEVEARFGTFLFSFRFVGGDEDRERGKEEAREGEVAGEGALLELATGIVVG